MDLFVMVIKVIFFLTFVLSLIYLSLKYGATKFNGFQNGRYIRILERVPVSKDNSIMAVKIGNKGYLISSSNNGVEILFEIDKDNLEKLETQKTIVEYKNLKDFYENIKSKRKKEHD